MRGDCDGFLELYELKWNESISSQAARTLYRKKHNHVLRLPLTEDITTLSQFLQGAGKETRDKLNEGTDDKYVPELWRRLAEISLSKIILFNRRRQGEASKMLVTDNTERANTTSDDISRSLSKFEQALCRALIRIEVIGKRGRVVPVLLTSEMSESLQVLLKYREKAGVALGNVFMFAINHSHSAGHSRGSDCLKKHSTEAGLKHPENVSSTKLRKHIATMTQLFNLKDHEMDLVAQYMGHDIRIHREYYRLPSSTLQLAKVSKILVAMDSGAACWS